MRNAVTLCGSKGEEEGTCHWAFDNHRVGIVYSPLTQRYEVTWYVKSGLRPEQLAVKSFAPPDPTFNPYKRGLAYHALAGASQLRKANNFEVEILAHIEQLAKLSMSQEENKVICHFEF